MKAVVMAGGEGSRLRPLTIQRPKPMVPIVNKPVMEHVLDLLKRHGITEVVVTVQYLASVIQDNFGDGSSLGMHISYSVEDTPLGTAGSVRLARQLLGDDTFVVISADALTDFDLEKVVQFHREKGAEATLTLYRVANPLEYGVIITNESGHITQFLEKPSWGEVFSDTVNTGIYVLEPTVLDYIEEGRSVDFSQEVFPWMLKNGKPIYGFVSEGYWCDVGDISEYRRANADVLQGKVRVESIGKHLGSGVWCESDDVEIAPDAQLIGPVWLGSGVQIKSGVIVRGPTVIREYGVVDSRALIDRSVLWRNNYIGERTQVRGAVICRQCSLKNNVMVFEGSVIGDNTTIGDEAIIQPNVKIWPHKLIEAGATISSSVIWGAQGRRVLFGRFGITGVVNIDLTPEFAARLGGSYGSIFPKGSTVIMNREAHRTPRMIKRAMISGLPSAGVNVLDSKTLPIPVVRYVTRTSDAVGGVHVSLSPYDNRVVDIKFFDARGQDIDRSLERKIESTFFRSDYRLVYLDEIGAIYDVMHAEEGYQRDFLKSLDAESVRLGAKRSIVVDYASSSTSLLLPYLLNKLGVGVVALNASIDEAKMMRRPETMAEAVRQMALITMTLHAELGARLDPGGERLFVADENGEMVPNWTMLLALARLKLAQKPGGIVVVPLTAPQAFEKLAQQFGGKVFRTRNNQRSIIMAATSEGVVLAGDGDGGIVFPSFNPAFDSLFALAKTLELLGKANERLVDVIKGLPAYYMAATKVQCPWEEKGRVMRLLSEQCQDQSIRQPEGVKVTLGDEWVLVLPDLDKPEFSVVAESASDEAAQGLMLRYAKLVNSLVRS